MNDFTGCFKVDGNINVNRLFAGKFLFEYTSKNFYSVAQDGSTVIVIPEGLYPEHLIVDIVKSMRNNNLKSQKEPSESIDQRDERIIKTLREKGIKLKTKGIRTSEEEELKKAYDRQQRRKADKTKREREQTAQLEALNQVNAIPIEIPTILFPANPGVRHIITIQSAPEPVVDISRLEILPTTPPNILTLSQ